MAKNNYIQIRVSDEQKINIRSNAAKNNQTITDYIMSAIIVYEEITLELYGSLYGYGCPYQYARQVIRLAIEVLDKEINNRKDNQSKGRVKAE